MVSYNFLRLVKLFKYDGFIYFLTVLLSSELEMYLLKKKKKKKKLKVK